MSLREAAIALNRFGLGARPGELRVVAADPRGWLREQVGPANPPPPPELAAFRSSDVLVHEARERRRQGQTDQKAKEAFQADVRQAVRDEMAARAQLHARTPRPYRERMVRFWANHLAISVAKTEVGPVAGAYEREAIRPRLGGAFRDLLLAAEGHPAMLIYLDNARSIGPNSPAGGRTGGGLNENHAREILELHTLGVHGGYAQADVVALAEILTGWGLARDGEPGGAAFSPQRHQPGAKRLLGVVYPEAGEGEAKAALRDLARHPATARFLATKLTRHLVADDPPESAVARIEQVFRDSDGDLPTVHAALIDLPEAWAQTGTKIKTPEELVISAARGLGFEAAGDLMIASARGLGQTPTSAPSPQGWPDRASDWLGPEAVLGRVEWARKVGRESPVPDALALADDLLGPLLGSRTRQALAAATDPAERLTLLVACPEFQRR